MMLIATSALGMQIYRFIDTYPTNTIKVEDLF